MAYLVELSVSAPGGSGCVGEFGGAGSLNDMLAGIRPVVEDFVAAFRDMPDGPDKIGVEFGLTFTADADLVAR
ncbi:hypothetical protein SAMN04487981_113238 [Streptomyces sp. cf386]|uniref:CU044_2847 family protein n=1 Tax=Streptomyces sp. cf386 TaxID=1761904 RepID=UPI000882131E|nr:CU044_2847 family protein [Streptomyces sp. cf386]SDO81908.1 hypothetical protein SAMN04487981_113238 [Streptomyces sp. cf386]